MLVELLNLGISEGFPTTAPLSLYGASKLASETLILEYGECFDSPVWLNRCGVLAGAGQFGKADQGIFSFWIHSFREKNSLKYIGFNGTGNQVRDALHPRELAPMHLNETMPGSIKFSISHFPENAKYLSTRSISVSGGMVLPYYLGKLKEKKTPAELKGWKLYEPIE